MKKFLLILLLTCQIVSAQSPDKLFEKGNEHYKLEQYDLALKSYQQIESLGFISSELFYNLGNCYYKLNEVAPAIYNYEKALMIDPLNEDASNNLIFAKRLTIDNIEELPKTLLQKLDESIVKKLSYNQWAIASVVLSILGCSLFLFFYFSYASGRKRFFFATSIISFLLLTATILFSYKEYSFANNNIEAIIFAKETEIKSAPTLNGESIFKLHEGTKVKVLDTVDNWKKIKISDGKIGWIISSELQILSVY